MAPEKSDQRLGRWLGYLSWLVILFAFLALLPSFWVPIGLPQEGDAVAYRVPLLKWILRHHAYPNWPWTYVEDYPVLGELLLLPFFAVSEKLIRVVPIFFYFSSAVLAVKISLEIFPLTKEGRRDFFFFCLANALALHPLLLQSNAVMVDNAATTFALASLYCCLRLRAGCSSVFLGLALATRYSAWGFFPGALLANLRMEWESVRKRGRSLWMVALSLLLVAPFLARNLALNGNPVFPLLNDWINGEPAFRFDSWGRGKGLGDLLLFPYDLLYTNSFENPFFDVDPAFKVLVPVEHFSFYTVGFLFSLQLLLVAALALTGGRKTLEVARRASVRPGTQALLLFLGCHFVFWWVGSQQLRFLVPELLLASVLMTRYFYPRLARPLLLLPLAGAVFSIFSVHSHAWQLAAGKIPNNRDLPFVRQNLDCIDRLNLRPGEVVGHQRPGLYLGYGDYDFVYLPPYPHYFLPGGTAPEADYVMDDLNAGAYPGYEPWPRERPCAFRKL